VAFRSPTPLNATTTSKLSFRVIAAFVTAASSQPSHTVFRECGWYLERERRSFTARRSTDEVGAQPAWRSHVRCPQHITAIHPSLRIFQNFQGPPISRNNIVEQRGKPMIGVGIPMSREANDEVLQRRTLRARAEIARSARVNPKCLPVSRESNCATTGGSASLVLRVCVRHWRPHPPPAAHATAEVHVQVQTQYCTRGRPSRPGRVHSTFPLKSTTAAAIILTLPTTSTSKVAKGRTLRMLMLMMSSCFSCNLFLRKRRAKISTS